MEAGISVYPPGGRERTMSLGPLLGGKTAEGNNIQALHIALCQHYGYSDGKALISNNKNTKKLILPTGGHGNVKRC